MKASEWFYKLHHGYIMDHGPFETAMTLLADLESLEAENVKQTESHAKVIESWKREEEGWDKELADLTASLAQANSRLAEMREVLEEITKECVIMRSHPGKHLLPHPLTVQEVQTILSAQPILTHDALVGKVKSEMAGWVPDRLSDALEDGNVEHYIDSILSIISGVAE